MATSHAHPHGDDHTAPQAEDDKLGPFGASGGTLEGTALRAAVIAEFTAAAAAARDAAGAVDASAATAVHEYRKALRRARAVLTLVASALPKSERRAVERALQEARRAVSAIRDHAVAPETLAKLELGDEERIGADAVLSNARDAMPPVAEIKVLLADGAKRASLQIEALEAALPREIELDTIVDGVRAIYAEARDARDGSKNSTPQFHTWRRRSKELVYQLDLLAHWAGKRVAALRDEADAVTDALSPAVDLIMLREFVATYAQGLGMGHVAKLADTIDNALRGAMKDARKTSRSSFARKPSRLAKKLHRAIRKDLARDEAPADEPADKHAEA